MFLDAVPQPGEEEFVGPLPQPFMEKVNLNEPETNAWGFLTQMGTVAGGVYEKYFQQEIQKSKTEAQIEQAKIAKGEPTIITAGFGPIAGKGGITQYIPIILLVSSGLFLVYMLFGRRVIKRIRKS